jgi:hypothetical protein
MSHKVQLNRLTKKTWTNRYDEDVHVSKMETAHLQRVMSLLEKDSQHYYNAHKKWLNAKVIYTQVLNSDEHAKFYGYLRLLEEKTPLEWIKTTVLYTAMSEEYRSRTDNRSDVDNVDELRRVLAGLSEGVFNKVAELMMYSVEYDSPQSNLDSELEGLYKELLKTVRNVR